MIERCVKHRTIIMAGLFTALLLFLYPAPSAHAQCANLGTNGLVAHWKLDESSGTLVDSSINSNTGTQSGGIQYSSTGIIDTAIGFDGVDDQISVTQDASINDVYPVTYMAWIKPLGQGDDCCPRIIEKSNGTLGWELSFDNTAPESWALEYRWDLTGTDLNVHSENDVVTVGEWSHIALTYDGGAPASSVKMYVDGVETGYGATNASSGTPNTDAAQNLLIGNDSGATGNFEGPIDDVRIYNRVLSAEEISAAFQKRSNATSPAGKMVYNASHAQMMYCDGTDWVNMGIGSYNPNAVNFDGTNDWLTASGMGPASDTKWTGSFWFKRDAADIGGGYDIVLDGSASNDLSIDFSNLDILWLEGYNTANTSVFRAQSSTAFSDTNWHHVLFSIDLSDTNKAHFYVDGTNEYNQVTYNTAETMHFAQSLTIGEREDLGGFRYNGDIADFWIDFGTYIDFSVEANRRKFISENGMPMYMGPDGSIPTGTAPEIFLSSSTENWHINNGTGGGFTETGEITTASTQPGDGIVNATADGYFVLIGNQPTNAEGNEYTGNLGGLSGANSECLSFLQTYPWLGKSTAESSGLLTSANVKAWLCDNSSCQDMLPNTTYNFATAQVGKSTNGGATFTTDSSGLYPTADTNAWDGATYFDRNTYFWTGRANAQGPDTGDNCSEWTSSANGDTGEQGLSNQTNDDRWDNNQSRTCDSTDQFICFVNPLPPPAGTMRYNGDFNVMEYANGTEWVAMGPVGGSPRTTNLIGHWRLDESSGTTASDSSTNANDGTLQSMNVPDVWVGGRAAGGLRFESGSDDYIDIGNQSSLEVSLPVTVTGWINPQNFNQVITIFYSDYGDNDYQGYACYLHSNDGGNLLTARFGAGGGMNSTTRRQWEGSYAGLINIGEWAHVACVLRGPNDMDIYINGTEINGTDGGTATTMAHFAAETSVINANDFQSGAGNEHFGAAIIDDVRVYDASLTADEIFQIYAWGIGGGSTIGSGGCSNPTKPEGAMMYNGTHNTMQYCNGQRWVGIGK